MSLKFHQVLFVIFALCSIAHADGISIGEISLPVDEISQVDDANIRIQLFSVTRIVPKESLELEVLNSYVKDREYLQTFGRDFWKRATEAALKLGRFDWASRTVAGVLVTASDSEFSDKDWFESVMGDSVIHPEFVKAIAKLEIFNSFTRDVRVSVLFNVAKADLSWFRLHLVGESAQVGGAIREYAEKRFAEALSARNLISAERIAMLLGELYGSQNPEYVSYKLSVELLKNLEEKGEPRKLDDLLPLISLRNSNKLLTEILRPSVVDGIHKLAEGFISRNQSESALDVLSYINSSDRTPTTHQLLIKALDSLEVNSKITSSKPVRTMLEEVKKSDANVRNSSMAFLQRRIDSAISGLRLNEARVSFAELRMERADPSRENDDIRVELARGFLSIGDTQTAKDELSKATYGPSLYNRIILFRDGLYGDPLLYIAIMALPLVFKFSRDILRSGTTSKIKTQRTSREAIYTDLDEDEEISPRTFVTTGGFQQLDPLFEEYIQCLKVFGIKQGSDLKAIKVAYRNAVKEVHPDLNVHAGRTSENSTKFMELTKAYDRLCELHKLLGL